MKRKVLLFFSVSMIAAAASGISILQAAETMTIESHAFSHGGMIPSRYTCDGPNVSPTLEWKGAPAGAKYFALICDDPDAPAGTWVHWIVYDIPSGITKFSEAQAFSTCIFGIAKQGSNSSGTVGYRGPCPPSGTHRYFFKLYALDSAMKLPSGASKNDLLKAMRGHILAESRLMGKYRRK